MYPSPNVAPKPADQSCPNSVSKVPFQVTPARSFFTFHLPLKLRVVHIRNKKRSNKHGILQTWSIVSVAMLLNHQERSPRKYCYQSSEIYCFLEINLSQIRISDSKREKVCAACPYFLFQFIAEVIITRCQIRAVRWFCTMTSSLVQTGAPRLHLPSLFLQGNYLHHSRTVPKVRVHCFPGYSVGICHLAQIFFNCHFEWQICHCYTFVSQNDC